jgi:hypothetical protein
VKTRRLSAPPKAGSRRRWAIAAMTVTVAVTFGTGAAGSASLDTTGAASLSRSGMFDRHSATVRSEPRPVPETVGIPAEVREP